MTVWAVKPWRTAFWGSALFAGFWFWGRCSFCIAAVGLDLAKRGHVGKWAKWVRFVICDRGGMLGAPSLAATLEPGVALSLGNSNRDLQRVRLRPELAGNAGRLEPGRPLHFLAGAVKFAGRARHRGTVELVTDLLSETAGLGEPQMMGIAGLPSTDQAGLFGDKPEMALVARATRHGNGLASSCRRPS